MNIRVHDTRLFTSRLFCLVEIMKQREDVFIYSTWVHSDLFTLVIFYLISVLSIEGTTFNITKVNRLHMGPYLCIASNGVPPSVSKRIMLIVHCEYSFIYTSFFPKTESNCSYFIYWKNFSVVILLINSYNFFQFHLWYGYKIN